MTRRLFGTDGIRGKANTHPMTAEVALALGKAAGHRFRRGSHRHRAVIGKDTRLSGYMLEPALTAGLISAGVDVILIGPVPTPGVAFLTRSLRADIGVMISASHNPYYDNGIKLFGPDGFKLSDEIEDEIEAQIDGLLSQNGNLSLAPPERLGRATRLDDARGRYSENLKSSFPKGLELDGLRIVVDCAHGAAYSIAPDLFWELGAEVIRIGTSPDGFNINQGCGSTHPEALRQKIIETRADLGVALDGDADRLVLLDEKGDIIDGDQVLAIIAADWARDQRLTGKGIVATQMSNLGLEKFLSGKGLELVRTKVGDRYVVEKMRELGWNVGGEQSGHIVMTDFATTGDGLLAALQVLAVLRRGDGPLSEIGRPFEAFPQKLRNLPMPRRIDLEDPELKTILDANQQRLGARGRLLVRLSGTEPLLRIMVEADDEPLLDDVLEAVSDAVTKAASSVAA